MPSRITIEERLFSLVLALVATDRGLTKAEILSTVQGYRQRFREGQSNAHLERQFERDKDDIRDLGIMLEVLDSPDRPGDNHALRYRIPRESYSLPPDVSFSPQELALLNLAGAVWREGSLSGASHRALTKLWSLGNEPSEPLLGFVPRVAAREPAFDPLTTALDRGATVRFRYLKPGESTARLRTVVPLSVVRHENRWHLYAQDRDVDARRTFLLSRITGEVEMSDEATPGEFAGTDHAEHALAELAALWRANVAEIEVVPGSDAAVRLENRPGASRVSRSSGTGRQLIRVHFTDLDVLADELAGFGPEVFVPTAGKLRDAVLSRLTTVVRAHAVGNGDSASNNDAANNEGSPS